MKTVELPRFDRHFFDGTETFTVIGEGAIGGKARGLADIRNTLGTRLNVADFAGVHINLPTLAVIATNHFDLFLEENGLREVALSGEDDHHIAMAFQRGNLPAELAGDLQALISKVHTPLAVRSSSLLEDAMYHPFAGVYETKMIPNNQFDTDQRFRKLAEAVKFVWASTYFRAAKEYIRAAQRRPEDEKMAVIIQEVVGRRHRDRFYPDLSGVARSYNFYPMGHARPKEGVVSLALGLGKTIVDGGLAWTYSPAYPRANPPYNSIRDLLQSTQTRFWVVNMGKPPEYDPIRETEFLLEADLEAAEEDETLGMIASTYDPEADRMVNSLAPHGPRVLTFAPLLVAERVPLNRAITSLLAACEHGVGSDVEIEFAVTFPPETPYEARLGFLQVRPMVVSAETVEIPTESLDHPRLLAASEMCLGNGSVDSIQDVVYLKPDAFDARHTMQMAREVEAVNVGLAGEGRSCLLIGFGRWGTSDPWLGVPVRWGQISQARVIVESSLPGLNADPSQGSHFFHNVTGFRVLYFHISHTARPGIDFGWLDGLPAVAETAFLRHVRLARPLHAAVDGRTGRGVMLKPEEPTA